MTAEDDQQQSLVNKIHLKTKELNNLLNDWYTNDLSNIATVHQMDVDLGERPDVVPNVFIKVLKLMKPQ